MILYRLLRSDENPLAWLRAKDPSSSVFVEYHLTHGSSLNAIPSWYISCCKSLEAVRRFAGCQQPIVKTELNGNNPTVHSLRIIDLTDLATLNQHIPSSNERGRNFANAFQEVLIEGFIPPECISQLIFYIVFAYYLFNWITFWCLFNYYIASHSFQYMHIIFLWSFTTTIRALNPIKKMQCMPSLFLK